MLVEHSVAESAQRLACLADSCGDFFVQVTIASNGASKILKWSTSVSGVSSVTMLVAGGWVFGAG